MLEPARLRAVRHPAPLPAGEALAWFATSQSAQDGGGEAVGYLLAADRAEWFRCAGGTPQGPGGARDLAGTFELYATGGSSWLRWFHQAGGRGRAVCLSEDAALLPAGDEVPGDARRWRLGGTARLLAGRVSAAGDEWATLTAARYPPCEVPVAAAVNQRVWAHLAEYAATDGHGNVTVVDTLLVSLSAAGGEPGQEEGTR